MSVALTCLQSFACFGGTVSFYEHGSQVCRSPMRFAVYQPPQAQIESVPVVYFLSGLTCTEENFMAKAGAQRYAAELGLMLVVPDTSPRHTGTPTEDADWDLGTGAGFYVDATQAPWHTHYQMYRYVTVELPALIAQEFPAKPEAQSICGHSMGGHGALICALRNPGRYRCVSALAPIGAPMRCPWGEKAFSHYLGSDRNTWKVYDASELVLNTSGCCPILIDQGLQDQFLSEQLKPELFEQACIQAGCDLTLRLHPHYDHSYYFIASFIGEHLQFHAQYLRA
ncbi:S-formylglutathione hydrolase [Synechococcales cyanobacterium C]|uniref:S-formylglutathione hydrolase n=1 Tax=Petrachloros mirabilis ULC683 TaxID=2781853 RepID=A0A8K1ZZ98_9CYAN|nr:S-formylglutathione hydrolase [Petrachloros mirabilis]NCJ07904.1 S-formylglutathione hydrolase [Petrachloros mirabilis ULC683]